MAEEIYKKLCDVTGPHREYTPIAQHILYGSYHFDKFNTTYAWRNTLVRFDEFLIPQKLTGKTVFDFGSCLGALSFESVRREASKVIGFEYNLKRVDVSNQLSDYLELNDRLKFVQFDCDKQTPENFLSTYGSADIVFCCALDAYVNKDNLYHLVSAITNDICYFETNSGIKPTEFISIMSKLGFKLVIHMGSSQSNVDIGRQIYILQKNPNLISQKRNAKLNVGKGGELIYVDNEIYRLNDYIIIRYVKDVYDNIKKIYDKISDNKYVCHLEFKEPYIITPIYTNQLYSYQATPEEKLIIKQQLIEFVRQLNQRGVIHRDLHTKNMFFHEGQLKVIDWEVACEHVSDLHECYDITGLGDMGYEYHCVGVTRICKSITYLLQDTSCSLKKYLDDQLTLSDFLT